MSADGEFSRPSVGTAAARATRSMPPAGPCRPAPTCSTTSRRTDWTPCSPTTPTSRSRSRSVYQPMIAAYRHENRRHGRELMARLIDSISTGVPKALVEITKLGRTLKKRRPGLLRPAQHLQRAHRGDQRQARAPARLGTGVRQPDQLHRQIPARDRRVQTPTTPWIRMSHIRSSLKGS